MVAETTSRGAASALEPTELDGGEDGILRTRGRWFSYQAGAREIRALACLHPAYLLRQPLQKRLAWRDRDEARTTEVTEGAVAHAETEHDRRKAGIAGGGIGGCGRGVDRGFVGRRRAAVGRAADLARPPVCCVPPRPVDEQLWHLSPSLGGRDGPL